MKESIKKRNDELYQQYESLTKKGENYNAAITKLSNLYEIGNYHVISILNSYGINKGVSNKDRDAKIIRLYLADVPASRIGKKVGLTTTRVSQILRTQLGTKPHKVALAKDLHLVQNDINNGMSHTEILKKYSPSVLRKLKSYYSYNPFDHYIDVRNKEIYRLSKEEGLDALQIADRLSLTRDRVYGILHDYGIRKRPTTKQYAKRNREILKKKESGVSSNDLADQYKMTVTNVNIIIKNMRNK